MPATAVICRILQPQPMPHSDDAILDDLLRRWHAWQRQAGVTVAVRGYAPRALVLGDYRGTRQYDAENGTLEASLEDRTMRAVETAVRSIEAPWRDAIYEQALNLAVGRQVWRSSRLPPTDTERSQVIRQARRMLMVRLRLSGVMEDTA